MITFEELKDRTRKLRGYTSPKVLEDIAQIALENLYEELDETGTIADVDVAIYDAEEEYFA